MGGGERDGGVGHVSVSFFFFFFLFLKKGGKVHILLLVTRNHVFG